MCLSVRDTVPHPMGILLLGGNMEFEQWLKNNNLKKNYSHFDRKVALEEVIEEIKISDNIVKHSFLPFIHYTLTFKKFSMKDGQKNIKIKERELYYSSHYDRCIFQYYSFLLNEKYNSFAIKNNINDCAIAYRNNLRKSNIHFAKEAFDFIKNQKQCFIIVSDFSNFFDRLNHKYLKQQLCRVLDVTSLSNDWYAVYKNITKYSWVELNDLFKYYNLENTPANHKELNRKPVILPVQELRKNHQLIRTQAKEKKYGIPQGSAISAILSNVYMIDFDKSLKNYIENLGGKYLRYSDDSIFIVPNVDEKKCKEIYSKILEKVTSIPDLVMQNEKTKIYEYADSKITNKSNLINVSDDSDKLDYLGFCYDGKYIYLRDKTVSKYYYRAYKKADNIVKAKWLTSKGTKIIPHKLYINYTLKGCSDKRNFISYAIRCRNVFGEDSKVNNIYNKHLGKIKHRLRKKSNDDK